jgi:hypothetical protein
MVWEFKQKLFISQRRGMVESVADLSQASVRERLQAHIDFLQLPGPDDPDEYAALFEEVFPAESDRRSYLDEKLSRARPSYGHIALAALMRAERTRLVWTTNFDSLIADACAKVFDTTSALTTVALDAPDLAAEAILNERWPVEIKLHGDFRSRRLKNTSGELRHQDAHLRQQLIDACKKGGLVVVGYSGRDGSIMETLEAAIDVPEAFPSGLFWLHREDRPPLPRVARLLNRGVGAGVETAGVVVDNFDEALRDLVGLCDDVDSDTLRDFVVTRQAWSAAPILRSGRRSWPVVRLNSLQVVDAPRICRRVVCAIGGTAEVREAVDKAGVAVVAVRAQAGVLAFGSDEDVRSAFSAHSITEFDLRTLEVRRLSHESAERGLIRDALTLAIARRGDLTVNRRRRADLLSPAHAEDRCWDALRDLVGPIDGVVPGDPSLTWREGVAVRLDWADERLWLLIEPRMVFEGVTETTRATAAGFGRERMVRRYNRVLNELLDFWATRLAQGGEQLRALSVEDGVDASFRMSPVTGFSRRFAP